MRSVAALGRFVASKMGGPASPALPGAMLSKQIIALDTQHHTQQISQVEPYNYKLADS